MNNRLTLFIGVVVVSVVVLVVAVLIDGNSDVVADRSPWQLPRLPTPLHRQPILSLRRRFPQLCRPIRGPDHSRGRDQPSRFRIRHYFPRNSRSLPNDGRLDWTKTTIDLTNCSRDSGARSRDAIRPLDSPVYEAVEEAAGWLKDRELGILFEFEGSARFYPLRMGII